METSLGEGDGCELPATAAYWLTDDPQPGLILVEFADVYDRPHQLVGKTAYFGGDLYSTSAYPCPTSIQCTIEEINDGVATVSTWWLEGGPNSTRFVFDVWLDTLTPITDA
ncbi:hypothetical protein ACFUTV_21285 [Streptomyces sp. NPDC057298]|uniref:hypothetical protein n=1 Tax=Streptomyces sp. NPDC057298 TaxID=3346091 RepID=UPI00363D2316